MHFEKRKQTGKFSQMEILCEENTLTELSIASSEEEEVVETQLTNPSAVSGVSLYRKFYQPDGRPKSSKKLESKGRITEPKVVSQKRIKACKENIDPNSE